MIIYFVIFLMPHPSWPPSEIIAQGDDALSVFFASNYPMFVPQTNLSDREEKMIKWTACEYIEARKEGTVSCEEYCSTLVKRMIFYQSACVFTAASYKRTAQIIEAAKKMDKKASVDGIESIAPLYGLPIPAKGTKATVDFESCAGSTPLASFLAIKDCEMVKLIKNANGVIMGKTNVPEFAASWVTMNPTNGITRNAYAPQLTAGGSSGGSGAAIAFSIAPVATTEDTGGSTRHPALQNQAFGYDPTRNHYPNLGNPGFSYYNDQVGLNAKSIEDILLVDAALLGTQKEHLKVKQMVNCLANKDIHVGLPLFPYVEFELPIDAYNAHNLRNIAVSCCVRNKYNDAIQALRSASVSVHHKEFPDVESEHFGRKVNALVDAVWSPRMVNGKPFDGTGFPGFHSFTGQMAEWIHEYLGVNVGNKEIFDQTGIAGRGHNPINFFSAAKVSDESQFRYSSISQIEKVKAWNSYFDEYNVHVIMTPPQFFDAVDFEHVANATLPLEVKQEDGTYKTEKADIGEGNLISYLALKDIPIPKMFVPTGLDHKGRPTGVTFWGKSVPVNKLYDDEYAKKHDLEFLYIVQKLKDLLYTSNPSLRRQEAQITPLA